MTDKKLIAETIESKKDLLCEVSDRIWEYAELSLMEDRSAQLFCRVLEEEGFAVSSGTCGIRTAFTASAGSGRPVIGILAEYDALSGLSQQGGAAEQIPLPQSSGGHGCGHNLLGAGALAAVLGVRAWLKESGLPGTVILFGCPGEEGGAAKAFMARDGVWKDLDCALTWHPDDCNEVVTGSSNSCIQVQYLFHGISAHAASEPEAGRSALDAVELMNIGVQFLREHMPEKARIHYAVTDAGGRSPNVVPCEAGVLYMVRSNHVSEAVELQKRVDDIAKGAALMTGTTLTRKFIDGLSDTVTNHVLENVLYENYSLLGVPEHTQEELAFAAELAATFDSADRLPGIGASACAESRETVRDLRSTAGPMNDFLLPLYQGEAFNPGSTDVGDVSWLCPTAQIHVASVPNGCPAHSWQTVSAGKTSLGHKALLHAGKVLGYAAADLFADSGILEKAREEFFRKTSEGFVSPIPADAVPVVPD